MLKVLFEDESLFIVDKPAGLMVHPSWLDRHETDFAQARAEEITGQKLHTLHRLDRPTSGILAFGKNPEVARAMMATFETHEVNKFYLCIARGWTPPSGVIEKPLKVTLDPIADKYAKIDKEAQEAITCFRTLTQVELPIPVGRYTHARYSLNLVRPITGRQHQIRKHYRKLSHHLIGDTRYGDGRHNKMLIEQFKWNTLGLRAVRMEFPHPVSGEMVIVNSGLNEQWRWLFNQWGWQQMISAIDEPSEDFLRECQELNRVKIT